MSADTTFPCRLCSTPCLIEDSLYYVEYYGTRHLSKMLQQQQQQHGTITKTTSSTAADAAPLDDGVLTTSAEITEARRVLCERSVAVMADRQRRIAEAEEAAEEAKEREEAEDAEANNSNALGGISKPKKAPLSTAQRKKQRRLAALASSNNSSSSSSHPPIKRIYYLCTHCKTVFVPSPYLVSSEREKAEYDLHENNTNDEGYRSFLARAVDVVVGHFEGSSPATGVIHECVVEKKVTHLRGLDFGCGPGPTICHMLGDRTPNTSGTTATPYRYTVTNYDKYYNHSSALVVDASAMVCVADDEENGNKKFTVLDSTTTSSTSATSTLLKNRYDFITTTEVVEHLSEAGDELKRLWSLLASPAEGANERRHKSNNSTEEVLTCTNRQQLAVLVIMTKRAQIYANGDDVSPIATAVYPYSTAKFTNWHYKNDPTHITYFTEKAFAWCRDTLFGGAEGCRLTYVGADVVVFEKLK